METLYQVGTDVLIKVAFEYDVLRNIFLAMVSLIMEKSSHVNMTARNSEDLSIVWWKVHYL